MEKENREIVPADFVAESAPAEIPAEVLQAADSGPLKRIGLLGLVLSFLLPLLILGVAFALKGIYPFGDKQILVVDFYHQYYPFLQNLWHTLREGRSLLWTWVSGGGVNYTALIAYYLASPLNLLIALFPVESLREVVVALLLVKVGLAGLFYALFLRYSFGKADLSLPAFSTFYALCAFILGYYWNIIWIDTFALLPLVILGVRAMIREGKYRLYVAALFLSVLCNYYIGLFTCIFVAISFFAFCVADSVPLRVFLRRLLQIAGCSVLALGMTAVLTLPAYIGLTNSYSSENVFPTIPSFFHSFPDMIGNFIAFTPPTELEGLPNLYSGLLCILLMGVFAGARQIRLREKLVWLGLLVFFLVSCNQNMLDYMWHGFHYVNQIPHRFVFLLSFVLILIAYRAYQLLEQVSWPAFAGAGAAALLVLGCAFFGEQDNITVLKNLILSAVYLLLIFLFTKKRLRLMPFQVLVLCVAVAEVFLSARVGVDAVGTTKRSMYPRNDEEIRQLLDMRETSDTSLARTELVPYTIMNDPALYGYNGLAFFSSTVNVGTSRYASGWGLPSTPNSNQYHYKETSPLANAFWGLEYLIKTDGGETADGNTFWEPVGETENAVLFRNKYALPLGFMLKERLADFQVKEGGTIAMQNNLLFQSSVRGELFLPVSCLEIVAPDFELFATDTAFPFSAKTESPEDRTITWRYQMPEDGLLYVDAWIEEDIGSIEVLLEDESVRHFNAKQPYLFCAGSFRAGEIVSLRVYIPDDMTDGHTELNVCYLNRSAFESFHNDLVKEPLEILSLGDAEITGRIDTRRGGVLYTSIPYEKGWIAIVDGKTQEITPFADAMIALNLERGEHEITLRYRPQGLIPGILISVGCLAAFLAIIVVQWLYRKKTRSAH